MKFIFILHCCAQRHRRCQTPCKVFWVVLFIFKLVLDRLYPCHHLHDHYHHHCHRRLRCRHHLCLFLNCQLLDKEKKTFINISNDKVDVVSFHEKQNGTSPQTDSSFEGFFLVEINSSRRGLDTKTSSNSSYITYHKELQWPKMFKNTSPVILFHPSHVWFSRLVFISSNLLITLS